MSSSRLIYFCILSMSAAHLRRVDPQWSLDSAEYLSETVSTLRKQLANIITDAQTISPTRKSVEQTLLGVIMLGMSTSWHGTSGLGLEHIQGSRALFQRYIYRTSDDIAPSNWPKLSFYLGLQAYWESIASFLLDQDMGQLDSLHTACTSLPVEANRVNPWTGVDSTLWVLLAKAGCLVRKRRTLLLKKQTQILEDDGTEFQSYIGILDQQAIILEQQILTYTTSDISRFEATQDNQTIISHLELIARCCRFAALLELYRAFSSTCNVIAGLRVLMITDGEWLGDAVAQTYLDIPGAFRALALGMLKILRSIPKDSNTKCLHSLLLLIAGSALSIGLIGDTRERYHCRPGLVDASPTSATQSHEQPMQEPAGFPSETAENDDSFTCATLITRTAPMASDSLQFWRGFVQERMTYLEGAINLDGMRRIKTILSKVWDYNDSLTVSPADNDLVGFVHWIDIMEAYELEFLF
ncbi:hypothetical protein FSARC_9655 [Fusarium sarcochroum]|uniref:Uncharacterized protein n=1 Tax=Fusarium sarcochroum TaxID=1208366 RepID=A0A8H4X619_9HYPO|nr:hypothetical protein FSARC_9655 [Fusarium sarcochroum]